MKPATIRRTGALTLTVALILGGGTAAAQPANRADTAAPQPARHPCASATERCDGTITVPLDWHDPSSPRIEVAFAWIPRTDRSRPATGTIMANGGGPTAAIRDVPHFRETLGPVLRDQNLLIVDPRGFGASSPLVCEHADLGDPATIRSCARERGPRTRLFSSDQAVTDIDAVRAALGVPAVTFYGNSYGTVFGQAYATRFPGRVRAVFLDSVVGSGPDGYLYGLGMEKSTRYALTMPDQVCDPSRACRAIPGRPLDNWVRVLERLRDEPDPAVPPRTLLALNNTVDEPAFGREANAAAAAYLRGDHAPLRRLAREWQAFVDAPAGDDYTSPELPALLSFTCGDSAHVFDRDATPAERHRRLDEHYATNQPFLPYRPAEALADGDYPLWCADWPSLRDSPPVPPGARYPDVPVLVIGGPLDSTTPPQDGREVAGRFPRGRFVEVPFGTHATAFGMLGPYSECVRDFMRAFLADPDSPPEYPGCDGATYRALGSFPRTVTDVRPAVAPGLPTADRRLIAAAFGTAVDALSRRSPGSQGILEVSPRTPGLRGGEVRFDDERRRITLHGARFAADLPMSGTIRYDRPGRANAELRTGGDRAMRLSWRPFRAEDTTTIIGELDGRPFTARVRVR